MAKKKTRAVRKSFTAVLEPDGTALKWTIARIPFDVAKVWPGRKGRRVRGEIEGFPFRTTLVSCPSGKGAVLMVNRQMRAGATSGRAIRRGSGWSPIWRNARFCCRRNSKRS